MSAYPVRIIHTETLVTVGRFHSIADARYWLDHLAVATEYKDRCYRIIQEETVRMEGACLDNDRRYGIEEP